MAFKWKRAHLQGFALLVVVIVAVATWKLWWPRLNSFVDRVAERSHSHTEEHDHHSETAGVHGASDTDTLELSQAARRNLGLTPEFLKPIEVRSFHRSITIPGMVIARPGRTQVDVSAPLTGVVTHVHAVTGEAVTPGTLLFEVRLTHEELVTAQTEFLKSLGELDVEKLEIQRLEGAVESGAVSGRTLLERKYSSSKLEALLRAQREALKLHGLSDRQVDEIEKERKLLRSLQIVAPSIDTHSPSEELRLSGRTATPVSFSRVPDEEHSDVRLVIENLAVRKGQSVTAGQSLCVVADLRNLYIEGQAFEQDASSIHQAVSKHWPVTAIFPGHESQQTVDNLALSFVGSGVHRETRALPFFVELPNQVLDESTNAAGQTFVTWKYRPGQRLQLQVPVEEWPEEIVVPVDAVVRDGADSFVFRQNGKSFVRVSVHIRYRDETSAVIANDGSVFPGDVIALRSAHQIQMALKNKSGVGADPHAGHNH